MRSSSRAWVLLVFLSRGAAPFIAGIAILGVAAEARGDEPTAADRETVRGLLADGDRLVAAKDYAGALRAYEGATALINVPTTAIEVARMQEALGLLVEARDGYLRVARMPHRPGEPAPFELARTEATQLGATLAERIPSVVIEVSGAAVGSTPVVAIDGIDVPQAVLRLPRKVNPGKRSVVVRLDGYKTASIDVQLREGESRQVDVSLVVDPDAAPASPALVPITSAPTGSFDDATDRSTAFVRWGVGIGATGLVLGTVSGLMSLSRVSSAREHCGADDHCTPAARSDLDASLVLANVSNVGFGVGLLGGGLALYGLVTRPSTHPSTRATLAPLVGLGAAGVRGTF